MLHKDQTEYIVLAVPLDAEGVVSNARLDPTRMVFARKVPRAEVPTETFGGLLCLGVMYVSGTSIE